MTKSNKTQLKLFFMDTSVFINCAMEEFEGLDIDILQKILSLLDKKETTLILPEVVQVETLSILKKRFDEFRSLARRKLDFSDTKDKSKKSLLWKRILENSIESALSTISKESKKTLKIIRKIFEHRSTIMIKLSEEIITAGLKRSLLMRRPYTPLDPKSNKPSFAKDQDCVTFESVLSYLRNNKKTKKLPLIICIDDSDYFEDKKKTELHRDILEDIDFKQIKAYNSPLDVLNKEFSKEFTREQAEQYKKVAENYPVDERPFGVVLSSPKDSLRASPFIAFDEPYVALDDYVFGERSLKIPKSSKFCPICGGDIKSLVYEQKNGLFSGIISSPYMSDFSCPFCGTRFKIGNQ